MRSTRRNTRNALKAIGVAFAAGAIFTGTAYGQVRGNAAPPEASEIPYLSHGQGIGSGAVTPTDLARAYVPTGGVTPTNLARAHVPRLEGVASPDGFQPQLRGHEPVIIRDAPDGFQPQTGTTEVATVSASSDGYEVNDAAIGFGLGVVLAMAGALALAIVRNRNRIAHT